MTGVDELIKKLETNPDLKIVRQEIIDVQDKYGTICNIYPSQKRIDFYDESKQLGSSNPKIKLLFDVCREEGYTNNLE